MIEISTNVGLKKDFTTQIENKIKLTKIGFKMDFLFKKTL